MTLSSLSGSIDSPTGPIRSDPAIDDLEVLHHMPRRKVPLDSVVALPSGAVLHDVSSGAWVLDVSEWGPNVDRALMQRIGDPVLICFGTHPSDECPLGSRGRRDGGAHGIVVEVVAGRADHARFVGQFSEALRSDQKTVVRIRKPMEHASPLSHEP